MTGGNVEEMVAVGLRAKGIAAAAGVAGGER